MSMVRKVVRVAFTISVCTLGLLLFGVWTRFDDYNLYQNLGHLTGIPEQHIYGFNLLGTTTDSSEHRNIGTVDAVNKDHSIVLSVCCLPDYASIQAHAQEYIDLFYTTAIESLGTASRQTPRSPTSTDQQYDHLQTKFTTDDISLRITTTPMDARRSPLRIVFEIKNHDDEFIENLIHQIWLRAHKLEVAMATTIDSHLDRHGVISVKWLLPHIDIPVLTVTTDHVDSVFHELDQLEEDSVTTREEMSTNELLLARTQHKEAMLRKDLDSLNKLVGDANKALPPLHDMQGFMDLHKQRLQNKVTMLSNELDALESTQKELLLGLSMTKSEIARETNMTKSEYSTTKVLMAKGQLLWAQRAGLLQELEQFEKEWDRMVHMTLLYESYLLHKYRVMHDRQYNLSRKYFVKEDGEDVYSCSHTADNDFCDERAIVCKLTESLTETMVLVEVSTRFPELYTMDGFNYTMALFADYGENDQCNTLQLTEGEPLQSDIVQECTCEDADCECSAEQPLSTIVKEAEMKAICLYIRCEQKTHFAMNTRINLKPFVIIEGQKNESEEVNETIPEPDITPSTPSGSLMTVLHRYTFTVTVLFTISAILMSVFFMPSN